MEGNIVHNQPKEVIEKLTSTLRGLNASCSLGNNSNICIDHIMAFRRYLADENSTYLDRDLDEDDEGADKPQNDGLSRFHSTELADAIMWMLPDLLRAMRRQLTWIDIQKTMKMKEEWAREASRQLERIFQENDPNRVFDSYIQNGLLVGNGFLIIQLMEQDRKKEVFDELNTFAYGKAIKLLKANGATLNDIRTVRERTDNKADYPDGIKYKIEAFVRTQPKIHVDSIPPEAVLIPDRVTTIDQSTSSGPPYIAIKQMKTRTELLRMFPEKEKVIKEENFGAAPEAEQDMDEAVKEERERNSSQTAYEPYNSGDEKMEKSFVCFDEYVRYDLDGDGHAELINVFRSDKEVLYMAEVDDNPLAPWSCFPVSDRFRAKGLNHRLGMIQDLVTRLTRAAHNAIALGVFPINLVDGSDPASMGTTANDFITQYTEASVGSVIKTPGPPGEVVGQINVDPKVPQLAIDAIRFTREMGERRTGGMTPISNTKGSNAYQRTATGQHLGQQREMVPTEYVVGNLSAGLAIAATKAYKLYVSNFKDEIFVEESKELITVDMLDPDAKINIHLGGALLSKDEKLNHLMTIMAIQKEVIGEYGPANPLASLKNFADSANEVVETINLSGDNKFFHSVSDEQLKQLSQNTQPDPKMMEAQAKIQREQILAEHKMKMEFFKLQNDALLEQWKAAVEANNEKMKLMIEAQLEAVRIKMEAELEKKKIESDERVGKEKAKVGRPAVMGGKVG